jgi:beta-lysine 5,6-aminomutase beta subunit
VDNIVKPDYKNIMPYGDAMNDGAMQLSFTLPVSMGTRAKEAAIQLLKKMGFNEASVVSQKDLGNDFTFFVCYGKTGIGVDYESIKVVELELSYMDFDGVNEFIKEKIGRKVNIVGACTGDDAHTVGIDAIMNMKGYDHHFGLERYPEINAVNLGSQVKNEDLIEYAKQNKCDAILVSQVVTQRDSHIKNLTNFVELAEAEGIRDRIIIIAGGPRIDHKLALELGFDAGFGPGTFAEHVASFVVEKMVERGIK